MLSSVLPPPNGPARGCVCKLIQHLDLNTRAQQANVTAGGEPATVVVEQERKRTIRVPLTITGRGFVYPGLTANQLAASPPTHSGVWPWSTSTTQQTATRCFVASDGRGSSQTQASEQHTAAHGRTL